jgi:hypothetical protein
MRKGFIPTLTALVSALLVTSAMALGPTISNVPDVFIGNQAASGAPAEPGTNVFRYSDALVLWDYVTPGVDTGDGSTSDTLYWAWAAKKADLSGGTGGFLDPSLPADNVDGIVYSIIQENAVLVDPIQPVETENTAAWTAEINNYLTGLGAGLADQSVGSAGSLTFRNIRLSPLPEAGSYPAPTANTGVPAGYYDVQEATLYVSDSATTPNTDTALILTVEGDSPDYLSGGPVWAIDDDWRDATTGFTAFLSRGSSTNVTQAVVIDPPGVTFTNSGTSFAVTVPATNPTGTYHLALVSQNALGGAPADAATLYRLTSTLSSSNAVAANNPGVIMGLNGRSTGTGWGFSQFVDGYFLGPQVGIDVDLDGYLWPVAAAAVPAQPWILDQTTGGGTITFDNVSVQSVDPTTLVNAVPLATATTFQRTDGGVEWSYFNVAYPGLTNPTWTSSPANSASGAELVHTGNTAGSASRQGFAEFGKNAVYTPTAGKLVVVEFSVSSNATAAATPDTWLNTAAGSFTANLIWTRLDSPVTGPTATAAPYRVVFEAPSADPFSIAFRAMAEKTTTNGDIRLQDVTVTEYDMPAAP